QGIKGLTFGDEADAANAAIPRLKAAGADAVVVLLHQGGKTSGLPDPNGCEALSGDILPILSRLDPQVDLVVSGHSHWSYVCDYSTIDPSRPFLLTSAGVYGELVTDITLTIDPAANRVIGKQARNVIVQSDGFTSSRGEVANTDLYPRFEPRADVADYVGLYTRAAADFSGRLIGRLSGAALRPSGAASNTGGTLGNLIADAQLDSARSAGAEIAFMNPFGIRAPIEPAADGSVTFGQLYATQPFNNTLVTQTMTGAEIKALLEQGLDGEGPDQLLAPSAGFFYRYDPARPLGDRIFDATLDGQPLDSARDYRVATNGFLAWGGDGFSVLLAQRDATIGIGDIEALEAWVKAVAIRQVPDEVRAVGPVAP
ncbi:MAG: bifunctional metallophosphatase/5'-nucleotidase, partial [Proteobacteria bacterium]